MLHLTGGGGAPLVAFFDRAGSKLTVPSEQPPNQQCAEAKALLWGLKFILILGVREAHLFGDNAAALVQYLGCKAGVGRVHQQRLLKSFRYMWASCPGFTAYCHWVCGTANPADPISRLHDQFGGESSLSREAATRRVGDPWAFLDRKTVFLWTLGVPMGPFVLPQTWQAGLKSHTNVDGAEVHDVFVQYRMEESMGVMT